MDPTTERLTLALREARIELASFSEAIAIIGVGVRAPNVIEATHDFWAAVSKGVDASGPLEEWRYLNKTTPRSFRGSMLLNARDFDADFFRVSGVEATAMDPQQRIALETAFDALAQSGISERRFSRLGVFVGGTHSQYYDGRELSSDLEPFFATGSLSAAIAGRIAYSFGLRGASETIDTACSSSLVAVHNACNAIRMGQVSAAIAGGVAIHVSDSTFSAAAAMHATSPDGRSKAFDASADGFGRGEGCIFFVLKALSQAEKDGDSIWAIIRGSGVNQDGRSASLSAPNGEAQQRVLRVAMDEALLTPTDIQYVEAHGTGTVLGDPIEVEALAAVYGEGRTAANPLHIGTIKTNIGHLEAAAGGAGLLKVLLSIRHRQLPPNLHFKTPNPHIPWDTIPIKVQTELTSWPEPGRPLIAGVSSFGITGTNAHVILSEPPPEPFEKWAEADALAKQELTLPLAISAKTPKALKEYAERFLELLDAPEDPSYFTTWRDIAHTSTVRRQHLEERLVVVGKSKEDWKEKLRTYLQGQSDDTAQGISTANGKESRSRLVVVFSGQGAQWWAMGRELFKNPVFQKSITECSDLAKKHSGWSIEEELLKDEASSRLSDTAFAQPCIVALQASLFALYKHWGVAPSAVVGHSIGEVSACYAAGVFTLDEALRLAVVRGRIMSEATGLGKMASVSLSEKECLPYLERINGLSVGAINSPNATVISGTTEAIATLLKTLAENGTQAKELKVDYAFHSAQMQPFLPKLEKELAFLLPKQPTTRIVSTLSGKEEKEAKESAAFGPAYWARQMRDPVRFLEATKTLLLADYDLFLELSPHPVLSLGIEETAESEKKNTVAALYSLKRHADDAVASLTSLGALHAHGYPVDWKRVFTNKDGNYVWGRVAELPNYPWQRQRYWLPEKKEKKAFDSKWPFIHAHTESASHPGEHIFQVELDLSDEKFAYLKDHKVQGAIWFPGAGFLEMALEVGSELLGNKFSGLSNIVLKESLVLSDTEPTLVQFIVSPKDDDPQHPKGALPFSISSKTKGDSTAPWALHASGRLNTERLAPLASPARLADLQRMPTSALPFDALDTCAIEHADAYRLIEQTWEDNSRLLLAIAPAQLASHLIHPATLHAATLSHIPQALSSVGHVRITGELASVAFATSQKNNDASFDIFLLDKEGHSLLELGACQFTPVGEPADRLDRWMWELVWKEAPLPEKENIQGPWLLIEDEKGTALELKDLLEKRNQKVVLAKPNFSDKNFYQKLLSDNFPKAPPQKIVHLAALDIPQGIEKETALRGEELACITTLFLVQAIQALQNTWHESPRLFLVTRGAQAPVSAPAQALLWGFGASLSHEMPDLLPTLVDLEADSRNASGLLRVLARGDRENRIALRADQHLAQRISRYRSKELTTDLEAFESTILITGGFGALGLAVASECSKLGFKHVALVGRTGPSEEATRSVASIRASGTLVYEILSDVSTEGGVSKLATSLTQFNAPAIGTILHAAAVVKDATIANLTPRLFQEVLAPKVVAATLLVSAFPRARFVYFSSVAGTLGSPGQGNYAAANAFLDAASCQRKRLGHPDLSISWGAWAEIGAATLVSGRTNFAAQALLPILPADGIELFSRALGSSGGHVLPFATDIAQFRSFFERLPLFSELVPHRRNRLLNLASLSTEKREDLILEHLIQLVSQISRGNISDIGAHSSLRQLAFDSLMVVSLRNRIETTLGVVSSIASFYSEPNLRALASRLVSMFDPPTVVRADVAVQSHPETSEIAIVGFGARLPGGGGPTSTWRLLAAQEDLSFPLREPRATHTKSGSIYRASQLDEITGFDASHFAISPLEAQVIDPQQRLVLETVYEAVVNASAGELGHRTGIYIGGSPDNHLDNRDVSSEQEQFLPTAAGTAALAGRTSYVFGLNGPSMTIDSACSSALVAIHAASDSLRLGQCDVALAGGVNALVSNVTFELLSAMQATSPDGRCKTFDASADGYGRGEGCGILVLKRLADAERDGDRVWGVIKGSAINQDGRSASLSAPNVNAQKDVLTSALKAAKLTPTDIQYVEAHGTGTVLGDPIEVEALAAVYGEGRTTANPLHIGTIKTNIGHLEQAAGVAGIVKVLLSIRHRQLPPNLHFKTPNPHIPWDTIPIKVQTELTSWPEPGRPLIAGVSSFGITGTNAHVILSEPPPEPFEKWAEADALAKQELTLPLAISAKTPKALKEYAERFLELLDAPEDPSYFTTWRDIAHTSTVRRQHLEERLVVVGKSKEDWKEKLRTYLQGQSDDTAQGISTANGKESRSRLVVVFSGQGAQWWAMGRELFKNPVFQKSITECSDLAKKHSGWSIEEELLKDEASSRLSDTAFAQPCIVALQASLFALYKHWGVAPSAVVGHSIGEVSACYAAGVFTLDEALRLAVVRGRIMSEATGLGKMASVSLSEKECLPYLERINGLSVGAINSPNATVISGTTEAIATLLKTLAENGTQAKELKVDYAFHSAQMQPFLPKLEKELAFLLPKQPTTRIVSTLSGKEEKEAKESAAFGPAYWARQMRDPVRFLEATKTLLLADYDLFLELSPHPVLSLGIEETAESEKKNTVAALYSLKRHADDAVASLTSLGALHAHGYPVDWKRVFTNKDGNYVWGRVAELPNYPWQRQRYWLPEKKEKKAFDSKWPFIHAHTESASHPGEHIFQVELDLSDEKFAYLKDHKVQGAIWFPGAGFLEMALEVGSELLGNKFSGLSNIVLKESLVLSDTEPTLVQFIVSPKDDDPQHPKGALPFSISSKTKGDSTAPWALHASGRLNTERLAPLASPARLADLQRMPTSALPFDALDTCAIEHADAYRLIEQTWEDNSRLLLAIAPAQLASHLIHPATLHAATLSHIPQALSSVGHVRITGELASVAFATSQKNNDASFDIFLLDKEGHSLLELGACQFTPVGEPADRLDRWMWELVWKEAPLPEKENIQGPWLLIEDEKGTALELKDLLEKRNQKVVLAKPNFSDKNFYQKLLSDNFPKAPPQKIVHLAALDIPQGIEKETALRGEELACITTLFLVQAIQALQNTWHESPRLFLVTRGAQAPVSAPAQALLWGFGASLAEFPQLETVLIDLSVSTSSLELLTAIAKSDKENRVALRNEKRLVQRFARHRKAPNQADSLSIEKTHVLTGGTGGVGLVLAAKLVELGAKKLLLLSRRGETPEVTTKLVDLRKRASVRVLSYDVTSPPQSLPIAPSDCGLILHAAGLDGTTASSLELNQTEFRRVLAPKLQGTLSLLRDFPDAKLILFSSISAWLGLRGSPHYAAANAFLDAVAEYRPHLTQSLAWGLWGEVGMGADIDTSRSNLPPMKATDGAELFAKSLNDKSPHLIPFAIDVQQWVLSNPHAASLPLLSAFVQKRNPRAHDFHSLSPEEREKALLARIVQIVSRLTRTPTSELGPHSVLKELGFDSLMFIALRNALEQELGVEQSVATLYAVPNLGTLAHTLSLLFATPITPKEIGSTPATAEIHNDIAIIGAAFKLPSADTSSSAWRLVSHREDTSAPLIPSRLLGKPRIVPRASTIGDNAESFDPLFFGISPVEASIMDPQQRLVIETIYEALVTSPPSPLTGVFIGAANINHLEGRQVDDNLLPFLATATLSSALAGRSSFVFDLHGPSVTLDTACSSALVAIHQATDSLRAGQCTMALAGGVNVLASDRAFSLLSTMQATSPDGRCKTFDASADGYGRGEGCGILVLKRLADAERDGDRVWGVIKGSAINQDGRSASLSAPNVNAQKDVLTSALKAAKLTPTDIQYVEAHGTGTVLGDPIEVEALAAVYGEGRTAANPLHIGTIKTNIGHLEQAAGVAGIVKVLLSIRHRQLPPNLHFKTPNPHIPWDTIPIKVQTELTSWPEPGRPLIAGVSSFGITGTNAHVILSEPPPEPFEKWAEADALAKQELTLPLAISAKTPKALKEYAERFLELLDAPEDPSYFTTWRDIAHTSTVRRQHLEERLVVVGKSKEDWKEKLRTYLQGQSDDTAQGISTANGKESRSRLVVVFSGQGAQWWAMGRELFKNPVFQKSITECSDLAKKHSGWSIEEELLKDEASSRLSDTAFAQPCIVALQASLFALYKHWGVAPSAVVGHSIGEVSACYAAGVFTLDEALRLAVVRGRIMSEATGLGKMASVSLSEKECLPYLERINGLSVGAINSPNATVISGTTEAIATLLKTLAENGTQAKELKVDYAFHSAQMQPFLPKLEKELAFLLPKQPTTRIVSTLSGKEEKEAKESAAFGPAYWARQMRDPVRFLEATKTLLLADYDLFLELSPHPVLSLGIEETAESEKKNTVAALYSLKRHADDAVASLTSLGALHAHGYPVDWKRVFTNKDGNYVWGRVAELPNYPWQRQRYWLPEKKEKKAFDSKWPFIHAHTESASHPGEHIFQVELDLSDEKFAYLKDHKVQGAIWFPGAGFLEMALEVGSELLGNKFSGLSNIVLKESLVLSDTEPTLVQFIVSPKDDDPQHPKGALPFSISSKTKGDSTAPWALHASGRLNTERLAPGDMPRFADVRNRANAELQAADLYSAFEDVELSYGPTFQGLISLATGEGEAIGKLSPPSTLSDIKVYRAHPALLDAAFQASTGALASLNLEQTFVPATIGQVRTLDSTASAAYALIKLRNNDPKNLSVDVYLLDKDAKLLAEVLALGLKPIGQAQDKLDKWMWEVLWKSVPLAKDEDAQGPWLLVQDHSGMADSLKALLEAKHQKVVLAPQNFSENDFYLRFLKEHFPKSPPKKLVLLSALDVPDGLSLEAAKKGEELACLSPLFLLQAVIQMQSSWDLAPKLFLVSKNAQPPVAAPAQALLWGLGACIPHELPELHTALIDIDASTSPQQLLHELTHSDNENRVALRNTNNLQDRLAQRLEKHRRNVDATPPTFPADKTVLITGGFGGLGPVVVSTLADLGAKHFALVGRTGASENTQKTLDALALEKHISIYPLKANIADNAQVAALPAQLLQLGAPAPFALVHAAVVLRDATIANQSTALVREALAPKVDGLLALLNAFRFEKIIHFSSASGLLGNGGQANYAAANALLDASAHYLHAHNTQALSLNWGAWADIGAATSSVITDNLARQGITAISPQQGAILLERSLAASPSLQQLALGFQPAGENTKAESLSNMEDAYRYLRKTIKSLFGAEDLPIEKPFKELGIDSLGYVSLRNRIRQDTSITLPAPTIISAGNMLNLAPRLLGKAAVVPPSPSPIAPQVDTSIPRPSTQIDESSRLPELLKRISNRRAKNR